MGFSFPASLGAKYANPDKNVISVSGDGGFQMNIQEIATAVENNLGVVVIVMNDNALGMVKLRQLETTGNTFGAIYRHNPDFASIAKSYGALGLKIEKDYNLEVEIINAVKIAKEFNLPYILDVPIKQYTDIDPIK